MMRLLTSILIITVFGFSQGIADDDILSKERFRLIGGITYSNIGGKDVDDMDGVNNLLGFKFGAEKILPWGMLGGISYTQRGFEHSFGAEFDSASVRFGLSLKISYLSLHLVKLYPTDSFVLFAGGEFGYFWRGKSWVVYNEFGEESGSETESISRDSWKDMDGAMLDFGLLLGGRYDYSEQLVIVGSYYYGIPDLTDNFKAMNRSIQMTVSYALK